MRHLLEILKIIDGALHSDRGKVLAYVEQLAANLEAEKDFKAAARIRRALEKVANHQLSLVGSTANERLPVDSESRLSLADEEVVKLNETEVFLQPDNHQTIEEFLRYVGASDRLLSEGVGISPSLIIYGPPGCGKTELARYIAARLGLPLLTGRTDSLISSYLGSTAKNLRRIFDHAVSRPCVLFFDEFDAVAKLRDDRHELGELKRVVISLIQNIDAMDSKTVIIAATNHEHLLDSAVWRRFSYRIHMGLPGFEIRSQLFSKFLGRFATEKEVRLFSVAAEGLTGSDIRQVVENAIRSSVLAGNNEVSIVEVVKRILKFRLPQHEISNLSLAEYLYRVRNLAPKVFTYRRLAEIFEISTGQVSNLLKKSE